jgi:hypothetical protein
MGASEVSPMMCRTHKMKGGIEIRTAPNVMVELLLVSIGPSLPRKTVSLDGGGVFTPFRDKR